MQGFFATVDYLKDQHSVVVDNVEEENDVDDERQQVLNAGARVAQVYLFDIDLCNDEDELDHDEGYQVNDSSCVVVEEEQLGLVECFSCLHQTLVLGLDYVFLCIEMLSEDFTTVLVFISILIFMQVRKFYSYCYWLLFIVDLVELYLLELFLSVVFFSLEAGDEAIAVGLDHRDYNDVDNTGEYNAHGREDFTV